MEAQNTAQIWRMEFSGVHPEIDLLFWRCAACRKFDATRLQAQIVGMRAHLEEEVSGRCWPLKPGSNRSVNASVIGICSYFCLDWTGVCSAQPGLVLNTIWLCSVGRGNDNDVKVDSTYATSFHASVFLNGDGTCTVKGACCFVCVICSSKIAFIWLDVSQMWVALIRRGSVLLVIRSMLNYSHKWITQSKRISASALQT